MVGLAAPVILAGGCGLALARVAALARSLPANGLLAVERLLAVALACAAGIVGATPAVRSTKRREARPRDDWAQRELPVEGSSVQFSSVQFILAKKKLGKPTRHVQRD